MKDAWIDVEFEVISAPLRVGDRHPRKRRWRYVGNDLQGRPLWYRAPILSKWQFAIAFSVGALAAWVGGVIAAWSALACLSDWMGRHH